MRKEIIIVMLLLLLSFPAVKALLQPGGFTSHDLTHHVIRQIDMDRLLSEGQFPPRWSGELNNGYGYPVFLFNYPLPAVVGEVFHKAGLGYVDSVKALFLSSMLLSALGMYLFLRSYLGSPRFASGEAGSQMASFLGSIFYLYSSNRFLNVYVAAAVGSALGGALVPFVFWSMVEIKKGYRSGNRWVLVGALFFALLILAHNVTALIFSSLFFVFAVLLVWQTKNRLNLAKKMAAMFLLGLGLSAWFWVPALSEKSYIKFDAIFDKFYEDQFPSLQQLIRSPWGFGLSHPERPEPGDLSYEVGIIHMLVMAFLAAAVFVFKPIRKIGVILLFFFVLSIFLILKISKPLWDMIPLLSAVQFPLRFSAYSIFTSSVGAALLVKYLPSRKLIFICLLILVIYANRNHWRINQVFDPGENYYRYLRTTTTSFDEHLPKWGRRMPKQSPAKLELIEGSGEVKLTRNQSAQVIAKVEATSPARLRFNQFYFPGWEIQVDGKPAHFNYLTDGESYGLPVFDIEKGSHLVEAEFKNTPIRNTADGISLISVVIWGGSLCRLLLRNLSKAKRFY